MREHLVQDVACSFFVLDRGLLQELHRYVTVVPEADANTLQQHALIVIRSTVGVKLLQVKVQNTGYNRLPQILHILKHTV